MRSSSALRLAAALASCACNERELRRVREHRAWLNTYLLLLLFLSLNLERTVEFFAALPELGFGLRAQADLAKCVNELKERSNKGGNVCDVRGRRRPQGQDDVLFALFGRERRRGARARLVGDLRGVS